MRRHRQRSGTVGGANQGRGVPLIAVLERRAPAGAMGVAAWLALAALLAALLVAPRAAGGQMPLLPVLQNGFVAPGSAVALNVGSSNGDKAYAAALSWAPRSGRFALAAGGGVFEARTGQSWPAYGGRIAVPVARLAAAGGIGISAFAGFGGGRHDSSSVVRVPAGIAAGWRRDLGATRGISVYAAPFFAWTRASTDGRAAARHGAMRGSIGADLALARSIGVTLGYEFGSSRDDDAVAGGGSLGAGVSYVFR